MVKINHFSIWLYKAFYCCGYVVLYVTILARFDKLKKKDWVYFSLYYCGYFCAPNIQKKEDETFML